jgi:hypothetical protein
VQLAQASAVQSTKEKAVLEASVDRLVKELSTSFAELSREREQAARMRAELEAMRAEAAAARDSDQAGPYTATGVRLECNGAELIVSHEREVRQSVGPSGEVYVQPRTECTVGCVSVARCFRAGCFARG